VNEAVSATPRTASTSSSKSSGSAWSILTRGTCMTDERPFPA
jgi:hypothetical protein